MVQVRIGQHKTKSCAMLKKQTNKQNLTWDEIINGYERSVLKGSVVSVVTVGHVVVFRTLRVP